MSTIRVLLRGHGTGAAWVPGAGGMCLHTTLLDPTDPENMFVAIAADRCGTLSAAIAS